MAAAKMEEGTAAGPGSISPRSNGEISLNAVKEESVKRQRVDRCYSFMEVKIIEPAAGLKSLKHLDSKKFKLEIKRWAKAVVRYARQVSDHFGSSKIIKN